MSSYGEREEPRTWVSTEEKRKTGRMMDSMRVIEELYRFGCEYYLHLCIITSGDLGRRDVNHSEAET